MGRSILTRIDDSLYREIKKEQEELQEELGRPVTFAFASRSWLRNMKKSGDFQIIRF